MSFLIKEILQRIFFKPLCTDSYDRVDWIALLAWFIRLLLGLVIIKLAMVLKIPIF